MNISTEKIKLLRQETNAGMLDCRKALMESGGDVAGAKAWLRERGIALGDKKSDRAAKEGVVFASVSTDYTKGIIFEMNSETDFVARNENFQDFIMHLGKTALTQDCHDIDALLRLKTSEGDMSDDIKVLSGRMGEKIELTRFRCVEIEPGCGIVMQYVHNPVFSQAGKIGVILSLSSKASTDQLISIALNLCLHVAAMPFDVIDADQIDSAIFEAYCQKEKEICQGNGTIFCDQNAMKNYGKESIIHEQPFIRDAKLTVKEYLEGAQKEVGQNVKLDQVVRFERGEN